MPNRGQFLAIVAQNTPLCREHYRLTLTLDAFPPTEPGQFLQILCHDPDQLTAPAMLRRPFSLAGRRDAVGGSGVELEIIHRVVGVGTQWLSQLRAGDRVSVLGPLGNTFNLPGANEIAILIGGGVGIPPMLYLAEKLKGRAIAFAGVMSRELVPLTIASTPDPSGQPTYCIEEFARHNIPTVITTDDGSLGMKGFITEALVRFLDNPNPEPRIPKPVLYTCGPEPMMKRVAQIAAERNLDCQIAVERAMACGMGTCQSCCIRVTKPDPAQPPLPGSDWCYRLACTDGPVFRGADLLW